MQQRTGPVAQPTLEISVDELDALRSAGDVEVIDVREAWEYRRGRVPGVVHLPLRDLVARVSELPRDRRLAIICEHGNRSLAAAQYLRAGGFDGVVSVSGGTVAWAQSGRPIERD
jgi:rhodanese-related sulfurtransferase